MNGVITALALPALLLAITWCWLRWNYRRIISAVSKVPPLSPTWPILGHIPMILKGHVGFSDTIFKLLEQVGERKEKNVSFWFGPNPYLVVGNGKDIETVLCSKKCERSFHYEFFRVFLGNGLLTAPDDIQKITRRHINPIFSPRNMEIFIQEINASSRNLAKAMSIQVDRGLVDVLPIVFPASFKTIGDLLLGPGVLPEDGSELFKQILNISHAVTSLLASRMECFWLWPDRMFNFLHGKFIDFALDTWKEYSERPLEVMGKKKLYDGSSITNETTSTEEEDAVRYITLPEVYDGLKRNYPQFTNKDMQSELLTLLETGSHSVKILIATLFLVLAKHPEIQERVYQEVVSIAGTEDNDVTTEDLKRMPYLEQVVKETTRKFGVVPVIIRKSTEELQLSNMTVPAGTMMVVSLITQHHDAEVFPDPQTFDPERFSPEKVAKMKKYSFTPFASGSRKCLGGTYVMVLTKTMVVHVIRKFKLSTTVDANKLKYTCEITKGSVDGYYLEVQARAN